MKKLSEIGVEVWPYLDATEKPRCYMLDEPACDGHQYGILMSPTERRELIAGAIYNYILDHVDSYALKDGESHEERLKKFFKEQGV